MKSTPVITTTDFNSLPWVKLYRDCKEAQDAAIESAEESRRAQYENYIKLKEADYYATHESAYEGSIRDELPYEPLNKVYKFNICRKATGDIITQFAERYQMKSTGVKILDQIVSYIGTFKLTTVGGEVYTPANFRAEDLSTYISGAAIYNNYFMRDEMHKGLYEFLMLDARGYYLTTQYKAPAKSFCALVPIIMYAFKLKGVPYSRWTRSHIKGIVNPKLAEAMLWQGERPSVEDCLKAREEGLTVKTGAKIGELRSPISTHKLYGSISTMPGIPEYVQVMYSQIWCAHPANRTKYMVLDPKDWDNRPAPLVDTEVIIGEEQYTDVPSFIRPSVPEEDNGTDWG